ncbi:MAG: hypothetical protein ABSD72_18580, partial [Terracidiphilus sp.]
MRSNIIVLSFRQDQFLGSIRFFQQRGCRYSSREAEPDGELWTAPVRVLSAGLQPGEDQAHF